ncbi:MAG: methionine--tRNA ligase [Rhodospirillaceae bacterium]|nr:methionine--tRNA ligase [Rhodospirillaceae bacterium]
MTAKRNILVTSALPYASGPLHLGHLVEYTQTDIWVRFQRMRGHHCIYVCASDAHGTPTMLRADEAGVAPEALVTEVAEGHRKDFKSFRISVDNYQTTHSAENLELTREMYRRLKENGFIDRRVITQAYDEQKRMFLPDRYVRGECPSCGAADQYGDACENCSATYAPMDLKNPVSAVSGTTPSLRESEHFFFRLSAFEEELRAWVPEHVDASMVKKLDEWFKVGLKDWDISRDEPYFGFEIPGETGKYFYVWFDAPIGYMASFLELCRRTDSGLAFEDYWDAGKPTELYHFIGKDIVYFHTLFWPSVLSGAGYRKPSGVFVHGFLTVDGKKMSKRRGTFIMASTYAKHLDPDYLRYYFAAKLGKSADDIDLNLDDFIARLNSDLVGKVVNIASRCAGFIHRHNEGTLGESLHDEALYRSFADAAPQIEADYEQRDYSRAMKRIIALADRANRYIDGEKPWILAKDPQQTRRVVDVCTLGINLFRTLMVYLKPVVPGLAERAEEFLNGTPLAWSDAGTPLLDHRLRRFRSLLERVPPKEVQAMVDESRTAPHTPRPTYKDEIDIELFSKVDMRIARVIEAGHVEGADRLLKLRLDLGGDEREVFAGIRSAYQPEDLVDRLVVVVANLKPRKMRFGTSQGMILASGPGGSDIYLLSPDSGAKPGMKVT